MSVRADTPAREPVENRAQREREHALRQREAEDLAQLTQERPVDCGASGVWWRFTREPIAAEVEGLPSGAVVFVGANARGLGLSVTRDLVRRVDGEPAPLDRMELSEQLRSGECVVVGAVPGAAERPRLHLHLNKSLQIWPEQAPGEFLS